MSKSAEIQRLKDRVAALEGRIEFLQEQREQDLQVDWVTVHVDIEGGEEYRLPVPRYYRTHLPDVISMQWWDALVDTAIKLESEQLRSVVAVRPTEI